MELKGGSGCSGMHSLTHSDSVVKHYRAKNSG